MNTVKFQTVANFIKAMAKAGQFSVDTAHKLANGEIILRDNTELVRKILPKAPAGTTKIIDSNTKRLAGISSFDGQKLEKSNNLVITHARIGYASDVATGKEASLVYKNSQDVVPAGLRSANIIIEQDGKPVAKLPVMDFVKPANEGNSAYTELSAFALVREEISFDIKIEFADGSVLEATDYPYVEVALKGMATFQR